MPRFDRTGPMGRGSRTGRGMGPCSAGLARGRGFGRGFGIGRFWNQNEDEAQCIKEEIKAVEGYLTELKKLNASK